MPRSQAQLRVTVLPPESRAAEAPGCHCLGVTVPPGPVLLRLVVGPGARAGRRSGRCGCGHSVSGLGPFATELDRTVTAGR